jgi:outer membrane protein OmpA-like peptidoglycan-associated protein
MLVLVAGCGAAFAQDDSGLTAEQLAARFQAQMTRGLVIAPPATTGTTGTAGATETTPQAGTYVAMDPTAQVNIRIEFAFDSAAIGNGEMQKLATLCQVIKASDIPVFKVIGHTDSSGSESYNQNLSTLRAEEVKRHLVDDCGVPANKLVAVGVGEGFPVDPKDPKADVNRRVEFQVGS